MQKRTSHKKSRRGCLNCKKKHVKCDEQTPRCANCVVRKNVCHYQSSLEADSSNTQIVSRLRRPKSDPTRISFRMLESPQETSLVPSPRNFMSSCSPTIFSSTPECNRVLELELMHRWSTRTWAGLYSIPEDQQWLQIYMPQKALMNSYLMNITFASAAADLAQASVGTKRYSLYLCAALEYANKASADFRNQLQDINEENIDLLFLFASTSAFCNFATPLKNRGILDRVNDLMDLLLGGCDLTYINFKWLVKKPGSVRAVLEYPPATMEFLDFDTKFALDQLTFVSSQMLVLASENPSTICRDQLVLYFSAKNSPPEKKMDLKLASEVLLYKALMAQLKQSFAEENRGLIQGYFLSVIAVGGKYFASQVKALEPMALFILMYIGVLLDKASANRMTAWWTEGAGRELIEELTRLLEMSPIALIPEGREGMSWCRQQVGLSNFF